MKTIIRLLAILILSMQTLAVAASAASSDVDSVDTSNWKCKYCLFEEGSSGTLDFGLGFTSDGSYKFGEYSGLNEEGVFLIGDASISVYGEEGNYSEFNVINLGLDSLSINIEAGQQGVYKLSFNYDQLPHFITDSASTPFSGVGTDHLTLPVWVEAATTDAMISDPGNSLHDETLETSRKRLNLGATIIASKQWKYALSFKNETREGTQAIGGSFFFNSARLIMPVDYETQQVDLSAMYAGNDLQAKFAYYGSLFSDSNKSLGWANPFTPIGSEIEGELALPPDNQFHQIMASMGYDISESIRTTADVAIGRMTQNEAFLEPTLNSGLAGYPFTLPGSSLEGLVDTLNANIKIASALTPKLRMSLAYVYNDHDDKTPQADYSWVSTDTFVSGSTRTNLPYSFTKSKLKLNADYRYTGKTKISAGIDNDTNERSYQEVSKTTENTYWVKAKTRAPGNIALTLKLTHGDRDISSYETLPWLSPAENPLLRKYNMADRSRDLGSLRADLLGLENMTFGFAIDFANDDYTHSDIGLTESQDVTYSADITAVLGDTTSLYAYMNRENIESKQAGSSSGGTTDWIGQNNDTVDTLGIGVKYIVTEDILDIGADFSLTKSTGEVSVAAGVSDPGFPDITVDLQTIKMYANYQLKDNLSLKATYWYEHFESTNWMLDGVDPGTISNVLTLGEESPTYYVSVIMMSLRYKF